MSQKVAAALALVSDGKYNPLAKLVSLSVAMETPVSVRSDIHMLFVKYLFPMPKAVADPAPFDTSGTLDDQCQDIKERIAEGVLPPDIGVSLLSAVRGEQAATQWQAIEDMVNALERTE